MKEDYEYRHPDKPDPTSYNPFVKETKLPFDFGKREGRYKFESEEFEFEKEGDVLLIDPDKPKPHLPGVDFEKMKGRFDDLKLDDQELNDHLVLNPDKDAVKKRTDLGYIDFTK